MIERRQGKSVKDELRLEARHFRVGIQVGQTGSRVDLHLHRNLILIDFTHSQVLQVAQAF